MVDYPKQCERKIPGVMGRNEVPIANSTPKQFGGVGGGGGTYLKIVYCLNKQILLS